MFSFFGFVVTFAAAMAITNKYTERLPQKEK